MRKVPKKEEIKTLVYECVAESPCKVESGPVKLLLV
jgi:hypothetical protein